MNIMQLLTVLQKLFNHISNHLKMQWYQTSQLSSKNKSANNWSSSYSFTDIAELYSDILQQK